MALTPKQQRFVTEYGLDLNATQAAIRAGYSPKPAQQQWSRLLRNVVVQAAFTAQQTEQLAAVEVRSAEVLRELMAIAHTDETPGYYEFSGIGTLTGLLSGIVPHKLASPTGFEPVF